MVGLRCLWNDTHGAKKQLNLPKGAWVRFPEEPNYFSEFSVSAEFIPVIDALIPDSAVLFHGQMFLYWLLLNNKSL